MNKKEKPEMAVNQAVKGINTISISNSMPAILQEIMDVLDDLHPDAEYNCKLNILLSKMAQMVSSKRIAFKEFENVRLINHYAINFMGSGFGKDRICNDLDFHIFKNFIKYFNEKAKAYLVEQEEQIMQEASSLQGQEKNRYIKEAKETLRAINLELNNATPEGLFEDAKTLKKAGFGSLFIKISEFGLFLQSKKDSEEKFLNALFEGYDGKVLSKSIKYGKREKNIENIPINALLHSDYNLFKTDIKDIFKQLMTTGLARRAFVSFQSNNKKTFEENPKVAREIKEKAYLRTKEISENIIRFFINIPENAVYELSNSANDNVFYPYCCQITKLGNDCEDDLLVKEIRSRELKVLKLAGMMACLNHPKGFFINELDVKQAIFLVEELSKDFKQFHYYRPQVRDKYDRLFNFFMDNLGKPFTKTQLVGMYKDFGFNRAQFRKEYKQAIEIVAEMAREKSCYFHVQSINNNSGESITLNKVEYSNSVEDNLEIFG